MGVRPLEVPRRVRARARRARRLRGIPRARPAARRDRDRLACGRRNTTPGSGTRTSSPTRRAGPPDARRGRAHGGVGDAVGEPRVEGRAEAPDPESERLHSEPASNYAEGAEAGHYVRDHNGDPLWRAGGWATGSPWTSPRPTRRGVVAHAGAPHPRHGRGGHQGRRRRRLLLPAAPASPTAATAPRRRGSGAASTGSRCSAALDEVHPDRASLFGRSGWSGQQRVGMLWGGDQASDFWSLQTLVAATLTVAATGFSNWSHDIGGYLGHRLSSAARASCSCAGCSSAASRR